MVRQHQKHANATKLAKHLWNIVQIILLFTVSLSIFFPCLSRTNVDDDQQPWNGGSNGLLGVGSIAWNRLLGLSSSRIRASSKDEYIIYLCLCSYNIKKCIKPLVAYVYHWLKTVRKRETFLFIAGEMSVSWISLLWKTKLRLTISIRLSYWRQILV